MNRLLNPSSLAGRTFVSLKTSLSPDFKNPGRSLTKLSSKLSPLATNRRAADLGLTGLVAINSSGN